MALFKTSNPALRGAFTGEHAAFGDTMTMPGTVNRIAGVTCEAT